MKHISSILLALLAGTATAWADDSLDTAPIPDGQEVYVALAPNWSNHGQYLWTSDGLTAGLVHLDTADPAANDFAAAAFIMVPVDEEDALYKFYHIQSRRYLYGLNYIAKSPDADPLDIYDGDQWRNRCLLTADAERAHALILVDDYTYSTHTRVIDYKAKGWTVIMDPEVEEPGDGTHYYGGEYGYCVYSLYADTGYAFGGFGAVHCGPDYDFYSADPWIVRTPEEMAAHLGLPAIDSQLPSGIGSVIAPEAPAPRYDLQGRPASAHGLTISAGRKEIR